MQDGPSENCGWVVAAELQHNVYIAIEWPRGEPSPDLVRNSDRIKDAVITSRAYLDEVQPDLDSDEDWDELTRSQMFNGAWFTFVDHCSCRETPPDKRCTLM